MSVVKDTRSEIELLRELNFELSIDGSNFVALLNKLSQEEQIRVVDRLWNELPEKNRREEVGLTFGGKLTKLEKLGVNYPSSLILIAFQAAYPGAIDHFSVKSG